MELSELLDKYTKIIPRWKIILQICEKDPAYIWQIRNEEIRLEDKTLSQFLDELYHGLRPGIKQFRIKRLFERIFFGLVNLVKKGNDSGLVIKALERNIPKLFAIAFISYLDSFVHSKKEKIKPFFILDKKTYNNKLALIDALKQRFNFSANRFYRLLGAGSLANAPALFPNLRHSLEQYEHDYEKILRILGSLYYLLEKIVEEMKRHFSKIHQLMEEGFAVIDLCNGTINRVKELLAEWNEFITTGLYIEPKFKRIRNPEISRLLRRLNMGRISFRNFLSLHLPRFLEELKTGKKPDEILKDRKFTRVQRFEIFDFSRFTNMDLLLKYMQATIKRQFDKEKTECLGIKWRIQDIYEKATSVKKRAKELLAEIKDYIENTIHPAAFKRFITKDNYAPLNELFSYVYNTVLPTLAKDEIPPNISKLSTKGFKFEEWQKRIKPESLEKFKDIILDRCRDIWNEALKDLEMMERAGIYR